MVYYAQNPCEAEGEIEEREELNYLKGPANVKIVYPNNTTFLGSVDENSMKTGLGRLLMLADDEEEEERGLWGLEQHVDLPGMFCGLVYVSRGSDKLSAHT